MTADLDQLSREELVRRARELGAERPEVMTRVELRDEIVRLSEPDPALRRRSRGWLGVARDLVASVVDAGLNLPGTAKVIRGDARPAEETTGPPPVATLTLAEIYLAQGHIERALSVLEELLATEPDHAPALELRARIQEERRKGAFRRRSPLEPEEYGGDEPPLSVAVPAPAPFTSVPPPEAVRDPGRRAEPRVEESEVPSPATVPSDPGLSVSPGEAVLAPPEETAVPEPPEAKAGSALAPELHATAPVEPGPHVALPFASEPLPHVPPAFEPEYTTEPGVQPTASGSVFETMPPPPPPPSTPTLAVPSPRTLADRVAGAISVLVQRGTEVVVHYRLPENAHGVLLRVVWFVPGRRGPTEGSFDVPLDPKQERVLMPPVDASAHVRGALGIEVEGAFKPLGVAWVYRVSGGGVSVAFAAPGAPPVALREQLGPELADLLA